MTSHCPTPEYLHTLQLYYEEEIEGEAYFMGLAARLSDPGQKQKMTLMAEVETYAAAAVAPLLANHNLIPRPSAELRKSGQAQSAKGSASWDDLISEMRRTFPGYIDDFKRLEALAPPQDVPALKILTAHEHAAIAFLEAEAAGLPNPTAPLRRYLQTGRA